MTEARLLVERGDERSGGSRGTAAGDGSTRPRPRRYAPRRYDWPADQAQFRYLVQTKVDGDLLQAGTALSQATAIVRDDPGAFPPQLGDPSSNPPMDVTDPALLSGIRPLVTPPHPSPG